LGQKNHAAKEVAALSGSVYREVRCNETTGGSELPFTAFHDPTRCAGNHARFKTTVDVTLPGSRKPQNVFAAFPECDLAAFLEFIATSKA
jgi:hypothetical protein